MTTLSSWIPVSSKSDFSLQNLPYGVFSPRRSSSESSSPWSFSTRCATVIGETIIDLSVLEEALLFIDLPLTPNTFVGEVTLNKFIAQPKPVWTAVRKRLIDLLSENGPDSRLKENKGLRDTAFHNLDAVILHLPIQIGEYTDFYSSREHATNLGIIFRGKDNPLQPNWLHLPVGYHGRASSVFVSGHSFHRPSGQLLLDNNDEKKGSLHAPCKLLDFELEVGTIVGGSPNVDENNGIPMTLSQAKDRIFGFVLLNDWSARDIQKFEYVPLGPFTSKNFATTISPWIVTADALEPFRAPTSAVAQNDPEPLEYLRDPGYSSYDVKLTAAIKTQDQPDPYIVAQSNFTNLYWNSVQQLVHHSVSGCVMMPGDILGSGTISGSTPDSYGSMMELSWRGTKEVQVGDEKRKFLSDGDTVILRGISQAEGVGTVGFGQCEATILPARVTDATKDDSAVTNKKNHRYASFKLYGYWRSSSTYRVRIALAAKSIEYETIPINLLNGEHKTPEYLEKNSLGQVPTLEFIDTYTQQVIRLSQSCAIIDFLEEAFPDQWHLFPRDPLERAVARHLVEVINSGTQPLQNQMFLKKFEEASAGKIKWTDEAKIANEVGLASLEVLVKQQKEKKSGPFCLGTFSPSVVDMYVVPQLYNARRFGVDLNSICPTLAQVDQICAEHPWFLAARPEVQPDAV